MFSRLAGPVALSIALIGCEQASESVSHREAGPLKRDSLRTVFRDSLSGTADFAIHEIGGAWMLEVSGHEDLDAAIAPKLDAAMAQPSLLEAYRMLESVKPDPKPAPQSILDLDRATRLPGPVVEPRAVQVAASGALAKSSAVDYEEDAREFREQILYLKSIRYHDNDWVYTNDDRIVWYERGYDHYARGKVASPNSSAVFAVAVLCGVWDGCSWDEVYKTTIQARSWKSVRYSGDSNRKMRRFVIDGDHSWTKTHLGVLWNNNEKEPPPTSGPDLKARIDSQSGGNINYTISNAGNQGAYWPEFKVNCKSRDGDVETDLQLYYTLASGGSASFSASCGTYSTGATVTADPDYKIVETNESNNFHTVNW